MLGITDEEIKAQAEKSCIMVDKNDRACYVAGYLGGYEAAETERQEYEKKKLLQENLDQQDKIVLLSQKVYDLQKAYDKQKEINKEQVDELEALKADWKTQVIVATEEAWKRTKLVGDVNKLENDCKKTQELLDKQIEATYKLDQENAGLKARLNAIYLLTPELQKTSDLRKAQLTKAKEIIKKFSEFANLEVEYDPEHPQEHTDLWDELCKEAEQFLKGEA